MHYATSYICCSFLCGCVDTKERITELYRFRIPDSDKVFYKCETYQDTGRDSWRRDSYCFLVDSTEQFDLERFKEKELPIRGYISSVSANPNKVRAIRVREEIEISEEDFLSDIYEEVEICTKEYLSPWKEKGHMSFHEKSPFKYTFSNISETVDSVFFEQITPASNVLFGDANFPFVFEKNTGFRKEHLWIEEDSLGYVAKVKMTLLNRFIYWPNEFVLSDTFNSMNEKGLIPKLFNGVNEVNLPSKSIVKVYTVEMMRDSLSQGQRVSDYGIFKKIEQKRIKK